MTDCTDAEAQVSGQYRLSAHRAYLALQHRLFPHFFFTALSFAFLLVNNIGGLLVS
jgi:hypothetical protein